MEENVFNKIIDTDAFTYSPKRILFANFPADGHFNPLTGLAVHLQNMGYDVRWYTSVEYAEKLKELNIQHYPFRKAMEITGNNFDKAFPGRKKIKSQVKKLGFDMIHAFILRGPEYYADMLEIRKTFPFEMVICDCAFAGIPFIKDKINIPVISIGVLPLTETSNDLPPMGLGLTPSYTFLGKIKQAALRFIADKIIFRKPAKVMSGLLKEFGIDAKGSTVFDILVHKSSLLLQSGTPGFEYRRSDLGENVRFVGAVLPYKTKNKQGEWYDHRLSEYNKVVLVTHGTVEKDISKLLIPTLEAFRHTDRLVIVTTGGSGTEELKEKYPDDNFIIEDFIPFDDIMPYADVYVTNGGYGGVMLSIQNQLPMVVAGVHEGKNEINARVGYFDLGINLRTETPIPSQIRSSVEKILRDPAYANNIKRLSHEFERYNPERLCASYVAELFNLSIRTKTRSAYN